MTLNSHNFGWNEASISLPEKKAIQTGDKVQFNKAKLCRDNKYAFEVNDGGRITGTITSRVDTYYYNVGVVIDGKYAVYQISHVDVIVLNDKNWSFGRCDVDIELGIMFVVLKDQFYNTDIRIYSVTTADGAIDPNYKIIKNVRVNIMNTFTIVRGGVMHCSIDNGHPVLNLYKSSDDSLELTPHKITIRDNTVSNCSKCNKLDHHVKFDAKSNTYVLYNGTMLYIYDVVARKFVVEGIKIDNGIQFVHFVVMNNGVFVATNTNIVRIDLYTGTESTIDYPHVDKIYTQYPFVHICNSFGLGIGVSAAVKDTQNELVVNIHYSNDIQHDVDNAVKVCRDNLTKCIVNVYSRNRHAAINKEQMVMEKRSDYLTILHNVVRKYPVAINTYDGVIDLVLADTLFERPSFLGENCIRVGKVTFGIKIIKATEKLDNCAYRIVYDMKSGHTICEDIITHEKSGDYQDIVLRELLNHIGAGPQKRYVDNIKIGCAIDQNYTLKCEVVRGKLDVPTWYRHSPNVNFIAYPRVGNHEKCIFDAAQLSDDMQRYEIINSHNKVLTTIENAHPSTSFNAFDFHGNAVVVYRTNDGKLQYHVVDKRGNISDCQYRLTGVPYIYVEPSSTLIVSDKELKLLTHSWK